MKKYWTAPAREIDGDGKREKEKESVCSIRVYLAKAIWAPRLGGLMGDGQ